VLLSPDPFTMPGLQRLKLRIRSEEEKESVFSLGWISSLRPFFFFFSFPLREWRDGADLVARGSPASCNGCDEHFFPAHPSPRVAGSFAALELVSFRCTSTGGFAAVKLHLSAGLWPRALKGPIYIFHYPFSGRR